MEPLGRQGFRSRWIRRRLSLSDPEGEGQENSLYQYLDFRTFQAKAFLISAIRN